MCHRTLLQDGCRICVNFDCFDPVGARKYHDTGLAMVTNRLETNIPHFAVTRTVRGLEEDKSGQVELWILICYMKYHGLTGGSRNCQSPAKLSLCRIRGDTRE